MPVTWIKIQLDMFDNKKIKYIRSLPEGNEICLCWIMLLMSAGRCNANGYIYLTENIPYTPDMLAEEFKISINTMKLALETFKRLNMIDVDENGIYIPGWEEYQNVEGMERVRELNRIRNQKYRDNKKQKLLTSNDVSVTSHDGTDIDIELDKDIDKEKDKKNKNHLECFESLWKLYPKKEGKGQVSEFKKKELYKLGYEQLERCIERYKKAKAGTDRQYLQNGSTFFNSGYVDYLDCNYVEDKPKKTGTDLSNYIPKNPEVGTDDYFAQ